MRKISKKRRIKGKTDYKARIELLKSGFPRIVIRKTGNYINVQYVVSKEAKDSTLIGVTSHELLKHGWPESASGSLKSIPAAYLTGYLAGKKIINSKNNKKVILDIGLQRNVKASRIYSALKGLVDAGMDINFNEKVIPADEVIFGKNVKKEIKLNFEKIKANIK